DDPRDVLEPAELLDDRRERRADDRLIERREQHDHHQAARDEQHSPPISCVGHPSVHLPASYHGISRVTPERRCRRPPFRTHVTDLPSARRTTVVRSFASESEVRRMAVEEKLSLEGVVEESLPNLMFRVVLDNGHSVLAHMAGRMRRSRIRVNPGDRVRVEVSPYDLTRARLIYRLK